MIALLVLFCWLIVVAYVPLVYFLTSEPPSEVRAVTNALVRSQAETLSLRLSSEAES